MDIKDKPKNGAGVPAGPIDGKKTGKAEEHINGGLGRLDKLPASILEEKILPEAMSGDKLLHDFSQVSKAAAQAAHGAASFVLDKHAGYLKKMSAGSTVLGGKVGSKPSKPMPARVRKEAQLFREKNALKAALREVERFQLKGELKHAQEILEEIADTVPDFPRVQYLLGDNLERMKKYPESVACFEEFLSRIDVQKYPDQALVGHARGAKCLEEARFGLRIGMLDGNEKAADEASAALQHRNDYFEAHVVLGEASLMLGLREGAERHFRTATRLKDSDFDGHYGLGRALTYQQKYREAEPSLLRASELMQNDQNDVAWLLNFARSEIVRLGSQEREQI